MIPFIVAISGTFIFKSVLRMSFYQGKKPT